MTDIVERLDLHALYLRKAADTIESLIIKTERQAQRIAELEAALKFYASRGGYHKYHFDEPCDVLADGGNRARVLLQGSKP